MYIVKPTKSGHPATYALARSYFDRTTQDQRNSEDLPLSAIRAVLLEHASCDDCCDRLRLINALVFRYRELMTADLLEEYLSVTSFNADGEPTLGAFFWIHEQLQGIVTPQRRELLLIGLEDLLMEFQDYDPLEDPGAYHPNTIYAMEEMVLLERANLERVRSNTSGAEEELAAFHSLGYATGHPYLKRRCLSITASLHTAKNEYTAALRALVLLRSMKATRREKAVFATNLGNVHHQELRFSQALDAYAEASTYVDDPSFARLLAINVAATQLALGNPQEAANHLEALDGLTHEDQDFQEIDPARRLWLQSRLHRKSGDNSSANSFLSAAIKIANHNSDLRAAAYLYLEKSTIAQDDGRPYDATEAALEALSAFRRANLSGPAQELVDRFQSSISTALTLALNGDQQPKADVLLQIRVLAKSLEAICSP